MEDIPIRENESIEDYYSRQIHIASNKIFRKTQISGADYILFKGKKAIEIYDLLVQKYKTDYTLLHRWIIIPIKNKIYKPSVIEVVKSGDNVIMKYPVKEEIKENEIPEIKIVITEERQPDIIETIIVD